MAAEIFARKGYRTTSITDIVEVAGIGRGTFYLYFESKREIFLELIESYFEGFAQVLEENQRRLEEAFLEGGNALAAWRENIYRVFLYHRDNPHLTSIVYGEAMGRDEDFSLRVDELSRLARKKLLEGFRLMERHRMLRDCDLETVTSMVMGSTINVIRDRLLGRKRVNLERLSDEFMEYHIRALAPRGTDIQRSVRSAMKGVKRGAEGAG